MEVNRFRFRAWDTKKQKMYHNIYLDTFYALQEDGVIYDELIIMQSTGLCDKNGKEIFEGDICDNVPDYLYFFVDYWKGMFGFNHKDNHDFSSIFEIWIQNQIKVIGNKFENGGTK